MNHKNNTNDDGTIVVFDPTKEEVSVQHCKIPKSGLRLFLRRVFDDRATEQLYQQYYRRQKRWLTEQLTGVIVSSCMVVTFLCCAIISHFCHLTHSADLSISCTGWLLTNVLIQALIPFGVSPVIPLAWLVLINLLTFVTLPVPIIICIIMTSTSSIGLVSYRAWTQADAHLLPIQQIFSDIVVLLGSILLGLLASVVADNRQRRAFLDTRKSLEMRATIEKQALEQEQLLLSVLPEHVAVKMRQDLGKSDDGQFKKIYMSRHENVSILFADIVGFTAISSTYPANELVHILNELFARFDHLSQKYHQMRIKILGDCYYCICGAPEPRDDHAVLCVKMGLAMIDAIKCVRESTLSPVDMRVGIHTGAVLAGVLGQRQWQYDVYSQDVELANKMESSGQPGRVHVSSRTLSCLDSQFEVEPAFGERREETLRLASIETYFILRAKHQTTEVGAPREAAAPGSVAMETHPPQEESPYRCCTAGPLATDHAKDQSLSCADRDEKDIYRTIKSATHWLTQAFYDADKESHYRSYRDAIAVHNIYAIPLAMITIMISVFLTVQWHPSLIVHPPAVILLMIFSYITHADKWGLCTSKRIKEKIAVFNSTFLSRSPLVCAAVLVLFTSHVAVLFMAELVLCVTHAAFIMSAIALAPHLFAWFKGLFLTLLTLCYTMTVWFVPRNLKEPDSIAWTTAVTGTTLTALALALFSLSRHLESKSRLLFLWQHQVEEQRERATDLRHRNQALIYNILPLHVASHILNARRQPAHQSVGDQLYSQSFTDVGILFASIPNFAEFYSEESVNNQGLECLRFLNEVISDFDALLDREQFGEITKIKTIGSTYMAASGLNNSEPCADENDVRIRWRTLALLVEFALAMQQTLQGINDQSFNHFVLRMGINHGPITAGVIGASKPHYDIWGNAVNVASRMESTGKAGHIQVTEETSSILRSFDYVFEERGLVSVKGKGQLRTYYLIGKNH